MTTARADAVISPCGKYRYSLTRTWGAGPRALFGMLNPSKADALINDPTIVRCIGFGQAMGAGSLEVANEYGLRATDPAELLKAVDPIGPENDHYIEEAMMRADIVIAAWGAHPMARRRAHIFHALAIKHGKTLMCLRQTKTGAPGHPLYLPASLRPVPLRSAP